MPHFSLVQSATGISFSERRLVPVDNLGGRLRIQGNPATQRTVACRQRLGLDGQATKIDIPKFDRWPIVTNCKLAKRVAE